MKLNSLGIVFKYHGDEVTRYWPWVKKSFNSTYHSSLLSRDFNSFNEYWKIIGEEETLTKVSTSYGRLHGFAFREIVAHWASGLWVNEYVVILLEPDPTAKGPAFWSRLNSTQRDHLMNDVVVLRCKDLNEATTLLESISTKFSDAFILFNGEVINSNDETWDWLVNHRGVRAWS
jgi:hypothetical protein